MGRPPLFTKRMTDAERQRRHREKVRAAKPRWPEGAVVAALKASIREQAARIAELEAALAAKADAKTDPATLAKAAPKERRKATTAATAGGRAKMASR